MRAIIFVVLAFGLIVSSSFAFEQTKETCYAYCVGWKAYWQNDSIWEDMKDGCSASVISEARTAFKVQKAAISEGYRIGPLLEKLYCNEGIRTGMEKKLDACELACSINPWSYGPDLRVTYEEGIYDSPAVWYDNETGKVGIKVHNAGTGYAGNVLMQVFSGSAEDSDCDVTSWEKISEYKVPALAPRGAKRNEEALPYSDTKYLEWVPEEGKCNKLKVIVDPYNENPEMGEPNFVGGDNEYVLIADEILGEPRFAIEDVGHIFVGNGTDDILLWFTVRNFAGNTATPTVQLKRCESGMVIATEEIGIDAQGTAVVEYELLDLFWLDEYTSQKTRCIVAVVSDGAGSVRERVYPSVYSETIQGTVYDAEGKEVEGATVTLSNGKSTTTDSGGVYAFRGITETGDYLVVAEMPGSVERGEARVNLRLDEEGGIYSQELHLYTVDITLEAEPAVIEEGPGPEINESTPEDVEPEPVEEVEKPQPGFIEGILGWISEFFAGIFG